ncbi:hypothetical protein [Microbacterium xylanilyticum]
MTDWTQAEPDALEATAEIGAALMAYLDRYGTDAYMECRAVLIGHAESHGWKIIEAERAS